MLRPGSRNFARRYLDGRGQLFAARIAHEKVRDGHGDLLADDIFCLDDGPRILDCIEFDDRLRYGDVLADVAFLAMDLERVGAADLGVRFLAWYREFAAENYPETLAQHYIAYRAHVRAKVACLRAGQGDAAASDQAAPAPPDDARPSRAWPSRARTRRWASGYRQVHARAAASPTSSDGRCCAPTRYGRISPVSVTRHGLPRTMARVSTTSARPR